MYKKFVGGEGRGGIKPTPALIMTLQYTYYVHHALLCVGMHDSCSVGS